jgi:hypothetical protein
MNQVFCLVLKDLALDIEESDSSSRYLNVLISN